LRCFANTRGGPHCAAAIHIEPRLTCAQPIAWLPLALPLDVLIAKGRLTEIPFVGDAIADIVTRHG